MKQLKKSYLMVALALSTCGVLFQNCAAAPPPDINQASGSISSVRSGMNCSAGGFSIADGASITAYEQPTVAAGTSCSSQTRTCLNGFLSGSFIYPDCSTLSAAGTASCNFNAVVVPHGTDILGYESGSVPFGSICKSQQRICTNGTLSGSFNFGGCTVDAAPAPVATPVPTPGPVGSASCDLNGTVIASGSSIRAYRYQISLRVCASELRYCTDGVLSGTYQFEDCEISGFQ